MSKLKEQIELRDNIAGILEISRQSWQSNHREISQQKESHKFPRSMLFRTLSKRPILAVAAIGSIWLVGPARFGAMAIAGGGLLLRHHLTIMTLVEKVFNGSSKRPTVQPETDSSPS
jgi:hypothetical protein